MSDLKADLASLRLNESPADVAQGAVDAAGRGDSRPRRRRAGLAQRQRRRRGRRPCRPASSASASSAPAGTPVLTASGYIVARREAIVSSKIQGRLAELRVEEGSAVREGDIIARLESNDFVASVARAQAQVQQADGVAELGRRGHPARRSRPGRSAAPAGRVRAAHRRQARARRSARRQQEPRDAGRSVAGAGAGRPRARPSRRRRRRSADLTYAQAQLQNTVIRAPFAGTVVRKMAEVGESVAPIPPGVNISTASGAIVALADLATLEMEADVNEANVAKLTEGQPAEVTVEAFPDRKYKAVLRQVIPTADRTKATVLTKVTLIDKDKDLKPEMSAKVTFLEPQRAEAPAGRGRRAGQAGDPGAAKRGRHSRRRAEGVRDRRRPRPDAARHDRRRPRRPRDRHRWPRRQRDAGRQAGRDAEGRGRGHNQTIGSRVRGCEVHGFTGSRVRRFTA